MNMQLFINSLIMAAMYGFISTGIVLLYKTANIRSFTQGEVLMISAYTATTLYGRMHLPYLLSAIMVIATGALVGILMDVFVFRPIRARVENHVLATLVSTLGLSIFFRNIAYIIWGYQPRGLSSPFSGNIVRLFGVNVTFESVVLLGLVFVVLGSLQLFLKFTSLGKSMKATSQNRDLANLVGIETNRTVLITCGLAGGLGGIAGLLIGPLLQVSAEMGNLVGLKAFMAAVIGGFGNPIGALLGSVLVAFMDMLGSLYISSSYKDAITFGFLILVLIIRPHGILTDD